METLDAQAGCARARPTPERTPRKLEEAAKKGRGHQENHSGASPFELADPLWKTGRVKFNRNIIVTCKLTNGNKVFNQ